MEGQCSNCDSKAVLLHHVVPEGAGGTNRDTNLVPLCRSCHTAVHKATPTAKAKRVNKELQGDITELTEEIRGLEAKLDEQRGWTARRAREGQWLLSILLMYKAALYSYGLEDKLSLTLEAESED